MLDDLALDNAEESPGMQKLFTDKIRALHGHFRHAPGSSHHEIAHEMSLKGRRTSQLVDAKGFRIPTLIN